MFSRRPVWEHTSTPTAECQHSAVEPSAWVRRRIRKLVIQTTCNVLSPSSMSRASTLAVKDAIDVCSQIRRGPRLAYYVHSTVRSSRRHCANVIRCAQSIQHGSADELLTALVGSVPTHAVLNQVKLCLKTITCYNGSRLLGYLRR